MQQELKMNAKHIKSQIVKQDIGRWLKILVFFFNCVNTL